jgi:hypothetical protein
MDRDYLIDLFVDFGPVTVRRMFSGFGISADGTNFALALRGGLYLRADEQTVARFEAEGSKPFQYQTKAKRSPWPRIGNCRSGCTTIRRNFRDGPRQRSQPRNAPRWPSAARRESRQGKLRKSGWLPKRGR